MQGTLEKQGQYELFETTKGHRILNLNNTEFYAVVKGQRGDILVRSDSDHQKKKTVKQGKFYLADFENDPEFNDIPHLFLQENENEYREWILPRDVPTGKDHQKKLVKTNNKVDREKVEHHVEGSSKKGGVKHASSEKENSSGNKLDLERKSKSELYNMARRGNIEGRSNMDKEELIKALSKTH